MTDINNQIRTTITYFASELNELVRQATVASVAQALGTSNLVVPPAPVRRGRPPVAVKKATGLAPAAERPRGADGRAAKRTTEELAEMAEQFLNYVRENPGQRIEAIGESLGIETKVLALPVKKLLAEGRVKTEGQKRATSYFVAGGKSKRRH